MTDEQIKQNAEEWVKPLISEEDDGYNENDVSLSLIKNAYIAGAHSRDEEINHLEECYEELAEIANDLQTEKQTLMIENVKLRNPWISVEERLPEEDPDDKGYSVEVIGLFTDGSISECFCSIEEDIWFFEGLTCDKPTHWMPMPKV
jgi:hypothetical protein